MTNLKVYDSAATRREGVFEAGSSFHTCFRLQPGGDLQPLVVVAAPTGPAGPPRDAAEPSIVARSEPVPQESGERCADVRILRAPLPAGTYWVSVLHGARRLDSAIFVVTGRAGETLLRDDFSDPNQGKLPTVSPQPRSYTRGYEAGEYVIRKVDPQYNLVAAARATDNVFQDAAIEVDAHLVGDVTGRYIAIACRFSPAGEYQFAVDPGQGRFSLWRFDAGAEGVALVPVQDHAAIRRGSAWNRLELSCSGSTISATINGVQVASIEDATHREGRLTLGVGTVGAATAEARFDNLAVVQR